MISIIKKALISEKSFQKASESKFSFIVDKRAGKDEIAAACEDLFGVNVLSVNCANFVGKMKRTKGKHLAKRSDFKKAVVTVKKGEKIDLFEIEKPEDKKEKAKKEDSKKVKESTDTTVKVTEKKKK